MNVEIQEGWTGPLEFQLLADGVPPNLTATTVSLILQKTGGTLVDTTGDIAIIDAANGKVRYSPGTGDLLEADSPLRSRFKVIDAATKVVYFPSTEDPDRWLVTSVP